MSIWSKDPRCACGQLRNPEHACCAECWYHLPARLRDAANVGSKDSRAAARTAIVAHIKEREAARPTHQKSP